MNSIYEYILTHWGTIIAGILIVINILNAITKHWSNKTGPVKVLSFITEILSFVCSWDVKGIFKPPFISKKPLETLGSSDEKGGKIASLAIPFLALVLASSYGCTTLRGKIEVAHQATTIAADLGAIAFHTQCTVKATECKKAGDTVCQPWIKCNANREQFKTIVFMVEDNLKGLNRIVEENELK